MRFFIHLKFILTHKGMKEKAEAGTCVFKCRCVFQLGNQLLEHCLKDSFFITGFNIIHHTLKFNI